MKAWICVQNQALQTSFVFCFLLLFIYHFKPIMNKMWQRLKLTISVNSKLTYCKIVSCCTTSLEKLFFVVHPCTNCFDLLQKEICLCAFWFCNLYLRSLIFRITAGFNKSLHWNRLFLSCDKFLLGTKINCLYTHFILADGTGFQLISLLCLYLFDIYFYF